MLQIGNYIFSLDIFEKKFKCDLAKCHGCCCLEGDSGAPLTDEEVVVLDDIYETIKPFLSEEGIKAIEKQGTSIIDSDGDKVTSLVDGRECVYAVYDNGILSCGIEKAFRAGVIDFQKPISCHLFPIRVKKFSELSGVNYQSIEICRPAVERGEREGITVFRFLKEPVIRAFGRKVYDEMCMAEEQLRQEGLIK